MIINDNIHDNFKTRFLHKFYEIDSEFTLILSPLALFWHYFGIIIHAGAGLYCATKFFKNRNLKIKQFKK